MKASETEARIAKPTQRSPSSTRRFVLKTSKASPVHEPVYIELANEQVLVQSMLTQDIQHLTTIQGTDQIISSRLRMYQPHVTPILS